MHPRVRLLLGGCALVVILGFCALVIGGLAGWFQEPDWSEVRNNAIMIVHAQERGAEPDGLPTPSPPRLKSAPAVFDDFKGNVEHNPCIPVGGRCSNFERMIGRPGDEADYTVVLSLGPTSGYVCAPKGTPLGGRPLFYVYARLVDLRQRRVAETEIFMEPCEEKSPSIATQYGLWIRRRLLLASTGR